MPKAGFKSITITKTKCDEFEEIYKELKKLGKIPPGITTFSAYVTHKLLTHVQEKKSLQKLALKITTVPQKFTESKLVINTINSSLQAKKNRIDNYE